MRFPKWFVGGKINISYNAIDRHIEAGRGESAAIHYESVYTGNSGTFGYRLKEGTNAGKVLKHLKKSSDNI